jgi:O-antigen ligase
LEQSIYGVPNVLAWSVLLAWFPLALVFFKKFEAPLATALTILGGQMFLPERLQYHLPIFPDLDKQTIPTLAALIGIAWTSSARLRSAKPLRGVDRWFLLLLVAQVGTKFTNEDWQSSTRPGLTFYDMITYMFSDAVIFYCTFLVGRAMFRTTRDLRTLLHLCVVFALIYTPLCLFEFKMGPQTNNYLYGFIQHDPLQAARNGGFRPMIFMGHGLVVARFMLAALLSGLVLVRARAISTPLCVGLVWLFLIFLNLKSMGALVMGLATAPLILFAGLKSMLRMCIVLSAIVLFYPLLRGTDMFPTEKLIDWATQIGNAERASSLGDRFENEDMLLEKARERLWFGWGEYGRAHVFDDKGEDISVVDGEWIIVLGARGLIGFLAYYGMYLSPVWLAVRNGRRLRSQQARTMLGGFALVTVLLAVDTLPNASMGLPHMFWSGALAGVATGMLRQDRLLRLKKLWALRAKLKGEREAQAALRQPA